MSAGAARTPHETPVGVRRAASLLLLRDGEAGVEVLMLRRAEREGDQRSGAAVFPGGILDPLDRDARALCIGADDAQMSALLGLPEGGLDYAIAALRETFEEVGLLLVDQLFDPAALQAWRERLQAGQADESGEAGVAGMLHAHGLRLDLRGLVYCAHWLTPPGLPKRFDTRFFAALEPIGQQAVADEGEAQELMWLTPQAAIDPQRGLKLMPVTQRILQELGRQPSAAAAMADFAMRQDQVALMMPRRGLGPNGPRVVLPDEHAWAEIGKLDAEGRGDASSVILPGRVVRLSPRVLRVTAANPGLMTGPGTNTYLLSDTQGQGWTVIDPGPESEEHLQTLLAAMPRRLERILVTHTHLDHSPGAAALARATGAPVWGQVAEYSQWQDDTFTPHHRPQHGERIAIGLDTTLRVIHTPGHASNHLCYLLEEEKLLFTGDHVMQGSTVVINPPDGDMQLYLRSLAELQYEDLEWLAPGHGFLVAHPQGVLAALIAHRLKREAKVRAALQAAGGPIAIDALLPVVYDDVPMAIHGAARRSLLAHLLKLQADGEADATGEIWRLR